MKKILAALCILFAVNVTAQETNNFSIVEETKLIWQKVYESNLTEQEIINTLINSGEISDVTNVDGKITFNIKGLKVDYEAAGYSRMDIPLYVSANDLSCFITIQVKEGRYRVTAEKLTLVAHTTGGLYVRGEKATIETYAIKKGVFTNHFNKSPKIIYDKCLSNAFLIKKKTYINEDW